jgi:hypothetical protein
LNSIEGFFNNPSISNVLIKKFFLFLIFHIDSLKSDFEDLNGIGKITFFVADLVVLHGSNAFVIELKWLILFFEPFL